jgi:hypothetical protein
MTSREPFGRVQWGEVGPGGKESPGGLGVLTCLTKPAIGISHESMNMASLALTLSLVLEAFQPVPYSLLAAPDFRVGSLFSPSSACRSVCS